MSEVMNVGVMNVGQSVTLHYITFQVVKSHYISDGHITLHFRWSHHIAGKSCDECLTIAGSGRRMTDGGAAKSGSTPGAFSFSQTQVWPLGFKILA